MEMEIELLEKCIYENPLALLTVTNPETLKIINSYIPFTVGFEIECSPLEEITIDENIKEIFRSIPFILDSDVNSYGEIRFQIPTGINGMLCLYYISENLKIYFGLNLQSGIHYHVGVKEYPFNYKGLEDYILKELDTWNYKGTYNERNISGFKVNWVHYPTRLDTVEYRIGEMSFDYKVLIKRIVHVCNITKYVIEKNSYLKVDTPNYEFDAKLHLKYLKLNKNYLKNYKLEMLDKKIKELLKEEESITYNEALERNLVKTRIIRI
jgi:hypothetical protein